MTRTKSLWCRRLCMLFCAILIFSTFMVPTAFADDVHIATAYQEIMYFEKYNDGSWSDLGTPPHTVVETGQPAYCLQMSMDSPYGDGYDATDGSQYYNPTILNGLKAILAHGYPASTGGFNDNQAQYATANAIRFFLAENGIQEMPAYLQDTGNARPKPGYEALFNWCLELLEYGRHPDTVHSISFSSSDLTLESQDYSFVGDVRVTTTGLTGDYTLDSSAFPSGTSITGYTGRSGDTLHISIPEEYEQSSYTLWASGVYDSTEAVLFFYAPTTYGQQRVVTCTIDMMCTYVDESMTVRTPKAPVRTGNIELSKVDENGNPVQGVTFGLYDSAKNEITSGVSDGKGKILFTDIPLGDYFYAEKTTLSHLVLDPTFYPVSITEGGQTVTKQAVNQFARGNVKLLKVDEETGKPLTGVHFVLKDSGGKVVAEGDTGEDGTVTFTGLLLGSYTAQETKTLVNYVLDTTPIPVEVTEHGKTYEITCRNTLIRGNLEVIKKDKYEDIYLSGAGFRLYDSEGNQIGEGYTDANGKLTFKDLLYGDYTYQEFKAPKGFQLDDTVYPFSITEHGVTVSHTRVNERRPGTLTVKKQDADGTLLPGTTFLLEYSTDKGSTWTPVFSRDPDETDLTRGGCTSPGLVGGQLTTGESGTVSFTGLRADGIILYRLTETQAPEGRSLMGGSLYVGTLPVESENIYASDSEVFDSRAFHYTLNVTATDDPIFRLPEAGGDLGFTFLPLAMSLMASPAIIMKKSKKKEINE